MSSNEHIYRIRKTREHPHCCVEKERNEPGLSTSDFNFVSKTEKESLNFTFQGISELIPFISASPGYFEIQDPLEESPFKRKLLPTYHSTEFLIPTCTPSVPVHFAGAFICPVSINFIRSSNTLLQHIDRKEMTTEKEVECNQGGDLDGVSALSHEFGMAVSLRNHVQGDSSEESAETTVMVSKKQNDLNSCDECSQHEQMSAAVSSPSISHSPSPVRSPIASPFAAATIKPDGASFLNHSLSDSISTPFDSDVCSVPTYSIHTAKCQLVHDRSEHMHQHPAHPPETYPEHLNPFAENNKDDEYRSNLQGNGSKLATVITPFDDLTDVRIGMHERGITPTSSSPTGFCECCNSVKSVCTCKRQAPPRPPQPNAELLRKREVTNRLNEMYSNIPTSSIERSHSYRVLRRSSSSGPTSRSKLPTAHHLETKSVIIKRQAPPIPIPSKRIIKADPEDHFIGYGELHQRLKEIHQKLTETERSSRAIQTRLKQGSAKNTNVDELLEKWTKLADVKDSLLKQEAQLLQRLHRQELEERHADVEHELRTLLAKQDALKTAEEKAREEELLKDLVHTVEKRAELANQITDGDSLTDSSSKIKRPHQLCQSRLACLQVMRFSKKPKSITKRFHIQSKVTKPKISSPSKSCLRSQSCED